MRLVVLKALLELIISSAYCVKKRLNNKFTIAQTLYYNIAEDAIVPRFLTDSSSLEVDLFFPSLPAETDEAGLLLV